MCFALTASSIQTSISKFSRRCLRQKRRNIAGRNNCTRISAARSGHLLHSLCNRRYFSLHNNQTGSPCIFSGELRCAPLLSLLSFPCFPAASTPVSTVITMEKKRAGISLVLSAGGTACTRGKCMADLSVHAGKGMELTAFHAVAGLVAGECSGSYHQSDCHVFGKTASRTLLPHPFRSVENDGQTVCFHGGSTYHQPGDDSSFSTA